MCRSDFDRASSMIAATGFNPWLDMEALIPGEEWEKRIRDDIRTSDIVLACLSPASLIKVGFVQAEMDFAWEAGRERTDGKSYLIPVLLEPCDIPARLKAWHSVRLFESDGYGKLAAALRERGRELGRSID
jgi:hypothetical protein